MLPSSSPAIPGRLPPPNLPTEPSPIEISGRPKGPEPLDLTQEKINKLEKKGQEWSQLRPFQLSPYSYRILITIAQRTIGELLSHPEVQRWIAGAKY
jgi:hypothetical protein